MAHFISKDFVHLLLGRIDLVELVAQFVPLKKKSGNNHFACCPFHGEKTASFCVNQNKQFYYCFGCGASGNAIDFLMNHERLSFPETIEQLARQQGLEIPEDKTFINNDKLRQEAQMKENVLSIIAKTAQFYYQTMTKSVHAIDYLKHRGISGVTAKYFQLGYSPSNWSNLIHLFGKEKADALMQAGLIIKKNEHNMYDRFRERLMFPIRNVRGQIIGFGGRIIDTGEPKYLNSPETILFQKSYELYGLYECLQNNRQIPRIIIVEGYMDVVGLYGAGITYAVATMGTATTASHIKQLLRYTSELVFCFDGDKAGPHAAFRGLTVIFPLMHEGLQIRFLFLPDNEDPDSIIRKENVEAFLNRITTAPTLSEFFLQTISQNVDLKTLEGRTSAAKTALDYLKTLPSGLYQSILIEETGKKLDIDVQKLTILAQIPPPRLLPPKIKKPVTEAEMLPLIKFCLACLIQNPTLVHDFSLELPSTNLVVGLEDLQSALSLIQNNPGITSAIILEHWRGTADYDMLVSLLNWDHLVEEERQQRAFDDAMSQISQMCIESQINHLLSKAAQHSLQPADKIELSQWIAKKKKLQQIAKRD